MAVSVIEMLRNSYTFALAAGGEMGSMAFHSLKREAGESPAQARCCEFQEMPTRWRATEMD